MHRAGGSRSGALVSLFVVAALGASTFASASAAVAGVTERRGAAPATYDDESRGARPYSEPVQRQRVAADREVELPRPVRGAAAVRLLGNQLDEAAALNDLSEAGLVELLDTDPTVWLDRDGAVFFKDAPAPAPALDPISAPAPLDQTFQLHSKPGAQRSIYLDFDGGTASGTAWHANYPATPTTQPAWDPSGNGAAFDSAELAKIQTIWKSVAEDYAPFDVDVTTDDPGPAGTNRANAADSVYGSRVLITPSAAAHEAICNPRNNGGGCGGVAYVGSFDAIKGAGGDGYGYLQPAWVFPQKLGNSPKNIAEAASHEVGHNFGLNHDGNASRGYDEGHGAWAPIMGVGYSRPVSQWSKGDYAGASNTSQDDVAIIRGVTGARADEAGASIAAAPAVATGTAYVSSRTDVDTYLLGTCTGSVSVDATVADFANLDIQLSILDASGGVVASADPVSAQTNPSVATGMSASLDQDVTSGTYYVSVDGVGNGAWSTGYDDYGSLGAYTLAVAGCDGAAPTTTTLATSVTGRSIGLQASISPAVAGTVEFREGATLLGTVTVVDGVAGLSVSDVSTGPHGYTASFVPADNRRNAPSTSSTKIVDMAATPTATTLGSAVSDRQVTLTATVSGASPPTAGSGTPTGTVEFREGTTLLDTVTLAGSTAVLTLTGVSPGDHRYTATYVPTGTMHTGSVSGPLALRVTTAPPTTTPVVPSVVAPSVVLPSVVLVASTTKVVAPRTAKLGTRPTLTVSVARASSVASGRVVVTVGTVSRTLTLRAGRSALKLAKIKKRGKVRITVRYLGDASTAPSMTTWTIRVTAG